MKKYYIFFLAFSLLSLTVNALENVPDINQKKRTEPVRRLAAGCDPASAAVNLDVNNVRARIMNGGDMWWDLVGEAKYEIPKVSVEGESRKTSLFAGALWIGGYDDGKNLRAAAMTYRQQSSWDFFPGPLDTTNATIELTECVKWDKIYQVTREEIDEFIEKGQNALTDNIRDWPAHGDPSVGQARYLAPYVEVDGIDGYDPYNGDYPDVFGDQTLWFVYNDKGGAHTETQALAIGLEIQTQAFAFATNNEINNMTFYQQKIINRSKNKLNDVYFGQWVDADLGFAYDDYVGCDSTRSLGICYNGDDFDEGVMGYGNNPPSVGVDFFQGPLADPMDGVDNDKDGQIDEPGEQIIMSKFVYYNNDWSLKGNPSEGIHFYYYLVGKFKNGQTMRYGGDGFNDVWEDKVANYMFPADPRAPYPSWSEVSAGNVPADRRFLQSAGPFTLKPGAVNYITVGVVWAKATSGGNTGSYDLLMIADDKAQKLYNNDFKLIDGPDAPDVSIQELDREIIISLENTKTIEAYYDSILNENDKYIYYKFQGYMIYQLANSTVTTTDLENPDLARLIARVDVQDGVAQLVNRENVPGLGIVPTEKVDESGDNGIKHTFTIETDAFSSGDAALVNYKAYYYMVISYSNCLDPDEFEQFLAGRKNIDIYTGIPHKTNIEFDGTKLGSEYGDGPEITRIEGIGNGGMSLELTDDSRDKILADGFDPNPTYKGGHGPVNVFVYDPIKVPKADFEIRFIDSNIINSSNVRDFTEIDGAARWLITRTNPAPSETYISDTIYAIENEQIFPDWGLSVFVDKEAGPTSDTISDDEGFIEAVIEYDDISKAWLSGIYDNDPTTNREIPWPYNWIRAGKSQAGDALDKLVDDARDEINGKWIDPNEVYETLLDGRFAPYGLAARSQYSTTTGYYNFGPAYTRSNYADAPISNIYSIDLVFTNDKSNNKWSQCVVIEMGEDNTLNEGRVEKFGIRDHASWTGNVDGDGNPIYDQNEKGRSWFPGYAINLETGERMNIIFGEDTYFADQNGRDMIWNPTYYSLNPAAEHRTLDKYPWGGKHWIYLMNSTGRYSSSFNYYSAYDGGKSYQDFYKYVATLPANQQAFQHRFFWAAGMYVMMPMLAYPQELLSLEDGLIPTETRVKVRVIKPYATYSTSGTPQNNTSPMYTFSTDNIAMTNNTELGKQALENVNIVPNPYYAFSSYEKNQLDNRVRIINLPRKCEVSIFTLKGALVRRITKDESNDVHSTYWDWDLKNHAGIPVASGIYIIHIDGYELGSKTIKWMGIMRPIDLDTF